MVSLLVVGDAAVSAPVAGVLPVAAAGVPARTPRRATAHCWQHLALFKPAILIYLLHRPRINPTVVIKLVFQQDDVEICGSAPGCNLRTQICSRTVLG